MNSSRSRHLLNGFLGTMIVVLLIAVGVRFLKGEDSLPEASIVSMNMALLPSDAFQRASTTRTLVFPDDHGPHPDFQTEWWYYTGNLVSTGGDLFGYQLTFFRRALTPEVERIERPSNWTSDQVYMAHFALTDVSERSFQAFERFSRSGADLADAQSNPFTVWLLDWQVKEIEDGVYQLKATKNGIELDLRLTDLKGPVLQGDQGYSQKGPLPGDASHYYSLTRLNSMGSLRISETLYQVSGTSWMDHEFSTSALSDEQIGWDWFSIQLDDQSELMLFQIRREDGSIDPFSSGTWISPDGSTSKLDLDDFQISVQDTWRSPHTGATYPGKWNISIPSKNLSLELTPLLQDQELQVSYNYWEGAVNVQGSINSEPISGKGYVELTGYAGSMAGQF